MSSSRQAQGVQPQDLRPRHGRTSPLGLYIHVPFCARKCPYCDFNTYAGLGALHERTVAALCAEAAGASAALREREVTSVFVGGGTPTVLNHAQLSHLLEKVHNTYKLASDCEITVEANPGTVDRDKFRHLRGLGVNRLSIGVQSFQPDDLSFLGRIHDVEDVYAAYEAARGAGFENVNLDFMFGLPHQEAAAWEDTLTKATALEPEHLSLYSLIVEPETTLFRWVEEGRVDEPDDDWAGELYERAMERLVAAGYMQYEVSNWAKPLPGETLSAHETPTLACRHNLLYWRNDEWLGFGPGAHGHARNRNATCKAISRRWSNVKPVPDYVRRVEAGESALDFREDVDARGSMGETMMLGLRLVREGVGFARFAALHSVALMDVFGREVRDLCGDGLLERDAERVRLTRRGLMLGNQVFAAFLADVDGAAVEGADVCTE